MMAWLYEQGETFALWMLALCAQGILWVCIPRRMMELVSFCARVLAVAVAAVCGATVGLVREIVEEERA